MPRRTRYDSDSSVAPDMFSLLRTVDNVGLSDCDTVWGFETGADRTQMQIHFPNFGSVDTELLDISSLHPLPPSDRTDNHTNDTGFTVGQDLPAGYQMSNGSSLAVSESRSTSTSSASVLPLSSLPLPSSRFLVAAEAQPHTGQTQANPCRSQRFRSETCLTAALRILTTLHVGHLTTCLNAHREAPTVQPARKMETVLSTIEDAVASMAPILACPCSANSLVQLLLLSICNNLIAWNGSMISADLEQGHDPFSSTGAPSVGSTQAPRLRVLPQPITIGQHQINSELSRILYVQVIVGELRILKGLIDDLSHRFCEARSDGAPSTSPTATTTSRDTPSLQSNAHRLIISSLSTRLQNTRAKIRASPSSQLLETRYQGST